MTMREKIAWAIYDVLEGPVNNADAMRQQRQWILSLDAADAVLDAMREPTKRMVEAGWPETNNITALIWRSMIDAAKGETE